MQQAMQKTFMEHALRPSYPVLDLIKVFSVQKFPFHRCRLISNYPSPLMQDSTFLASTHCRYLIILKTYVCWSANHQGDIEVMSTRSLDTDTFSRSMHPGKMHQPLPKVSNCDCFKPKLAHKSGAGQHMRTSIFLPRQCCLSYQLQLTSTEQKINPKITGL